MTEPQRTTAHVEGADEEIIVGAKLGYAYYNQKSNKLEYIKKVWNASDGAGKEERMRCNDGAVDKAGRYWVGTMNDPKVISPTNEGVLFRLDPDLSLHRMVEGATIPNGMGWSADDKKMYFIDTPTRNIFVYDFDLTSGSISNRQVFFHYPDDEEGAPDGFAQDVEGNLWTAVCGGWKVLKVSPKGVVVGVIDMPTRMITCPGFVGEDLFITSAVEEEPEKYPDSVELGGSLFRVHQQAVNDLTIYQQFFGPFGCHLANKPTDDAEQRIVRQPAPAGHETFHGVIKERSRDEPFAHSTVHVPNQSQTPCLKPSWDVNNVPEITAVVAVSHLTSPPSFPGPYAPSVLAERIPEYDNRDICRTFNASIKYLSHLHLQEVQGNRKAGTSRQCNGARGLSSFKDEVHMSQGPPVSRSSSSSNQRNDDRYKTLPPLESSRTLPPIDANSRSSRATNAGDTPASAIATPAHSPEDLKQSRSLGMHNILNPAGKESPEGQTRRRRMEQNELPSPAPTSASWVPSTTSTTTSPSTVSLPSITPPSMHTYLPPVGHVSRAIMTPRSASNYPPSLVTKPMPGTIDAKVSPFLRSNDPTNSSVPESSLSSAHSALPPSTLPFGSNLPPPRSPTGRRPSGGPSLTGTMDRRSSLAGSDSPSTTYSSYSTPPASQTMAPSTQPSSAFFGIPYSSAGGVSDHSSSHYPHNHPFNSSHPHPSNGPISSASSSSHHHQPHPHPHHHHNTSSYQIMTLETESGPIQVPVDVQAASKVADEKRKRNATASHRFRQRRKEKERETSCNIAKLEQQIRELAEERDFYARERDFYRGVMVRNPQQPGQAGSNSSSSSVVRERPTSPRHLRAAAAAAHPMVPSSSQQSMDSSASPQHWHHPSEDDGGQQAGRNTRRRTSSYVPAAQELPTPSSSHHPSLQHHPSHQHQQPHTHSHSHGHGHAHSHYQQQQQQQQRGYPQLQPANNNNNNNNNNNGRNDVHQGQQIGAYPSSSTTISTSTNEQSQWHPSGAGGPPPPPPPPPPSSSSRR
ncbi:hypothetical protein Q9189_001112 [Teloschistes chrysophthalmus]